MADSFVESILKEWGMEELIECFKEEGIDEDAFKLLDVQTIEALIKKKGTQLKFKNKFSKYSIENWVINSCTTGGSTASVMTHSEDISSNPSTSSALDDAIFLQSNDVNLDVNLLESQQFMDLMVIPAASSVEMTAPPSKKIKPLIFSPKGLEGLLSETIEGRKILQRKSEGFLENSMRNKLAKSITSQTFQEISEEIVDLFNKESPETYYSPYHPKTACSPKLTPKGKLYSKYVNLRAAFNELKTMKSPLSEIQNTLGELKKPDEFAISCLAFLKNAVDPWDTVMEYWPKTFDLRQKQNDVSITEYLNMYPALQQIQGYTLIEQDFRALYPSVEDNILYTKWPKIAEAVLKEAHRRDVKLPFSIGESTSVDNSFLMSLLYLPYLFDSVTISDKRKKRPWRPSRLEIQESFLLVIPNVGILEEKLEKRRAVLCKEKLSVQPFLVCVGHPSSVDAFYVIIDHVKYKVDTPLKAVDITYKSFHVLNAKYPSESAHVWTFVQKLAYEMTTPHDNISTATASLVADIKRQMN